MAAASKKPPAKPVAKKPPAKPATAVRLRDAESSINELAELVNSEVKRTDGIRDIAGNHERRIISIGQHLGRVTSDLNQVKAGQSKLAETVKSMFGLYSRNKGDIARVSERVDSLEKDFDEVSSISLGSWLLLILSAFAGAWGFVWICGTLSEKVRGHELYDFVQWGMPLFIAGMLTIFCLILSATSSARRTRNTIVVVEPASAAVEPVPTPAPVPSPAPVLDDEPATATEPVPVVSS